MVGWWWVLYIISGFPWHPLPSFASFAGFWFLLTWFSINWGKKWIMISCFAFGGMRALKGLALRHDVCVEFCLPSIWKCPNFGKAPKPLAHFNAAPPLQSKNPNFIFQERYIAHTADESTKAKMEALSFPPWSSSGRRGAVIYSAFFE